MSCNKTKVKYWFLLLLHNPTKTDVSRFKNMINANNKFPPFFATKQQGIRKDWSSSSSTNTSGVLLTNKGLPDYFGSMPWSNITLHHCCIVTGDSFPNTLNCIVQSLHSECSDVGVMTHLNTLRHCQLYFPVYQNEHWMKPQCCQTSG